MLPWTVSCLQFPAAPFEQTGTAPWALSCCSFPQLLCLHNLLRVQVEACHLLQKSWLPLCKVHVVLCMQHHTASSSSSANFWWLSLVLLSFSSCCGTSFVNSSYAVSPRAGASLQQVARCQLLRFGKGPSFPCVFFGLAAAISCVCFRAARNASSCGAVVEVVVVVARGVLVCWWIYECGCLCSHIAHAKAEAD